MLTGLDARDLVDSSRAGGGGGGGYRRAVWMDGRQAWCARSNFRGWYASSNRLVLRKL
jgi:hypothetical protein